MLDLRPLLEHAAAPPNAVAEVQVGGARIGSGAAIMGVINRSPGSWYRESVEVSTEAAVRRGRRLALEGAAIIDVGAESTLSATPSVAAERQTDILVPVVDGLARHGIAVSVETYHPDTADAALRAGAEVVNVTATAAADDLYGVIGQHDAAMILAFYAGANPRDDVALAPGADPLAGVMEFFERELERATRAGVRRIILDPGAGFYYRDLADGPTRVRHQLRLMLASGRLRQFGYPVCNALPHAFDFFGEEVRSAEAFFGVLAAFGGTSLFRTHEVRKLSAVLRCLELESGR